MKQFLEKYGIYIMLIVGIIFIVVFMTMKGSECKHASDCGGKFGTNWDCIQGYCKSYGDD